MDRCSKIHAALKVEIIRLLKSHAMGAKSLLDVGCWTGEASLCYAQTIGATEISGVEIFDHAALGAEAKGIHVHRMNLETEPLPIANETLDVIVCNQVFEHLKNIFSPMDEIARVLKPGGVFIVSVPNLSSFHNRIMLLLGLQPSSIRIWGPHVRGYAMREFTRFLVSGGAFEVSKITGVGFYPFTPAAGGNLIGNLWKTACHTPIWVLKKTNTPPTFSHRYTNMGQQTAML